MSTRHKISRFLFFILPFLVYTHKLITGVFFWEDVSFLHIPLRWFVHNAIKNNLSFYYIWNFGFGLPLVSEGQMGLFYPLKYIFIWLNDIHRGYTLEMLMTYFITYSGMFLFAKDIGLKKGAYISAIMFTFTGPLTGRHPFMNMIEVFSLMPWVFLTTRRFLITGKLYFAIFTAILISFQIFAFHPQALYMSSLSLFMFILLERESNLNLKKKLLFTILIHTVAIVLALPQLLPPMELLREKGTMSLEKFRGGYRWMQKGGLNLLIHSPYFFFPRFQGFHLIIRRFLSIESITLTLSGILLARIGCTDDEGKMHKVWLIMTIFAFVLMFVKFNPVYLLLSRLPVIKNFRYHVRWIIPMAFSLSLLAGRGFEIVHENPASVRKALKLFYLISGFLLFHYILARVVLGNKFSYSNILTFSEWSNTILLSLFIVILMLSITKRFQMLGFIVPGIFLLEIYIVTSRLFVTLPQKSVQKLLYSYRPFKDTRFFREGISFPVSIYDSVRKIYYIPPTDTIKLTNVYYRYYVGNLFIQDNNETNAPFTAPQLISDFLLGSCYLLKDTISATARIQFLKIFAINGLITTTPVSISAFKLTKSIFPFYMYRAQKSFKKYRFYSRIELTNHFTFNDFIHSPVKWDSIIPISNGLHLRSKTCNKKAQMISMNLVKDTLYMEIESPCNKFLFIPYRYHKGIKAILNNRDTPILKGFGEFITLVVPSGHSTIKIYYSFPFKWSIYLSLSVYILLFTISLICKNCTFREKSL